MKIYFAHSLTQAPEEFKAEMLEFRENLKIKYEVLEYFELIMGEPKDIFSHDIKCVRGCDLLLAEVSYPAIGLGFEIATALQLDKKVLCCAKEDAKVSRLVLGINDTNFTFLRYKKTEEILHSI